MMPKLNPDERLLIESGVNQYRVVGPGLIWLKPWEKMWVKFYIGSQTMTLQFEEVRSQENMPLKIKAELLYQTDPALFTPELLPKIPWLHQGIWQNILRWRTEHLLRQMLTGVTWPELGRPEVQTRLERRLAQTVSANLRVVGLKVVAIYLVRIELPGELQRTLVQAEQDNLAARGRALVLKGYFNIFGQDLARAMPFIVQWELLNSLNKQENAQWVLANSALALNGSAPNTAHPAYQLALPFIPRN
jgi:hypothetical protein